MELKILNKKDNPLLSRIEVEAQADYFKEATPRQEDIRKKIAAIEKANENLVVIKKVHGSYGKAQAKVSAYIYESEDALKKIEPKKKEKKAAKPEAAKEEAKEEPKEK